ncbi:MAG: hypothetical protein ACJA2M_002938 [Polaribacter sp.]|jgi:hypothetical protein
MMKLIKMGVEKLCFWFGGERFMILEGLLAKNKCLRRGFIIVGR